MLAVCLSLLLVSPALIFNVSERILGVAVVSCSYVLQFKQLAVWIANISPQISQRKGDILQLFVHGCAWVLPELASGRCR